MLSTRLNWLSVFVPALVILSLAGGRAWAADSRPTVDQILEQFEVVAFGEEPGLAERADRIIRWEDDLLIRIYGNAMRLHRQILRRHARSIEQLTGRSLAFTTDSDQVENVRVMFLPPLEMANLPGVGVDQKMLELLAAPRGCYFLAFPDSQGVITNSIIVVNSDRDTASIYHCLLEEMVQSMGLPNDTGLITPSIFNDRDQLTEISRTDEVLVRTLYDTRMVAGMEKSKAMSIARDVITHWDNNIPLR